MNLGFVLRVWLLLFLSLLCEGLSQECYPLANCVGFPVNTSGPSARDCCVGTDDGQSYGSPGSCMITQCIVHGFEQVSYTTLEGDVLSDINFVPDIKGTGAVGYMPQGTIKALEDTATLDDIASINTVLNGTVWNITVIPTQDNIALEDGDRILLSFTPNVSLDSNLTESGVFIRNVTIVYIIDDDSLMVSFYDWDYEVNEIDTYRNITMMIGETQRPFTLQLIPTTVEDALNDVTLNISGYLSSLDVIRFATPGRDFNDIKINLTIPASNTSRFVELSIEIIFDDNLVEFSEFFVIVGVIGPEVSNFTCFNYYFDEICHGRKSAMDILIEDDDSAVVRLERASYTVSEDEGMVEVCAIVTSPDIMCPIEFPFQVKFSTTDGTAVLGDDYSTTSTRLLFDTCDSRACVKLPVMDDSITENVESFIITLEMSHPRIHLESVRGEITIVDDDGILNFLNLSSFSSLFEDDEQSRLVSTLGGFPFGRDSVYDVYVSTNGFISMGLRVDRRSPDIPGTSSIVAPYAADIDPTKAGTVRYTQFTTDDYSQMSTVSSFIQAQTNKYFYGSTMMVAEWKGVAEFDGSSSITSTFQCVLITNGYASYAVFIYECGGMEWDGATIGWEYDDSLYQRHPFSGSNSDDVGCASHSAIVYRLDSSGTLNFLTLNSFSSLFGDYQLSRSVSAVGGFPFGRDTVYNVYVSTNGFISMGVRVNHISPEIPGTSSIVAPYAANIDPTEAGTVRYTQFTTDDYSQMSAVSSFIQDRTDDYFNGTTMMMAEWNGVPEYAGSPNITSTFQCVLITNSSVSYAVFIYECGGMEWDGATIGWQYDDSLYQRHLFSGSNSADVGCAYSSSHSAVVYRPDSTAAVIRLERAFYTVSEDEGMVEVCAIVTSPDIMCPIEFPFQVNFSTTDGTAVLGDDYSTTSTRLLLNFDICDSSACVKLSVMNDSIAENVESFNITLEMTYPRIRLESVHGVVTIVDDDAAVVGLERPSYTVSEDEGMVEVCAIVTSPDIMCPTEFSFQVNFSTTDGTAVLGDDYSTTSTRLLFDTCDSRACVKLPVMDDSITENVESFIITLKMTHPRIRLESVHGVITIVDDDDSEEILSSAGIAGITVSSIILALACVVLLIVFFYKRRKRLKISQGKDVITSYEHHYYSLNDKSRSTLLQQLQEQLKNKRMIISKDQLQLSSIVGQGESGLVYKAYLNTALGREVVAVKTGKSLFSSSDMERLAKEVSTMLSFEHSNVMSLIGVCIDGEMPLLVMPFMSNGSVHEYVKQHKDDLCLSSEATKQQIQAASKTLLGMCHQITKGMEYLSRQKFVHRDLAARNCMIDRNGVLKVADFGLTEDMYGTNYFRRRTSEAGSEEKVPIRWMAPESIGNNIYDEATDVWAFGVTSWEIFTCGRIPYAGIHVMRLKKTLESGERLERPDNKVCQDEIYEIMKSCWSLDPRERPRFKHLVNKVNNILEKDSGYLELSLSVTLLSKEQEIAEEELKAEAPI